MRIHGKSHLRERNGWRNISLDSYCKSVIIIEYQMNENPNCQKCLLCNVANPRSVCLKGMGSLDSAMIIFLDTPNMMDDKRHRSFVSEAAEFVRHCLKRMGIDPAAVMLDYTVKCYPAKKMPGKAKDRFEVTWACSEYRIATLQNMPNLRSIVAMGALSCEVFTGSATVGTHAGAEWTPREKWLQSRLSHVWVSYSPGYVLEKPSEAGAIFRVLWRAAEEAGLSPVSTKQPAFDFDV